MSRRAREGWLLALGFGLLALSQTRWGIGAFAWIAPVPLLAVLRSRPGWRFRAAFAGLSVVAWTLATLKIVTPPVPAAIALGYGIPLALVHLPPYLLWDRLVRKERDQLAIFAFAASTALLEWAQAELTPFGVWGAAPTSQVGNLPMLQALALAGMPGLSFLMNAVAAAIEGLIARRVPQRTLVALAGVTAALLAWGAVRVDRPIEGPEVRAAMIRTDSTVGGLPIPDADRRHRDTETLLRRTDAAADAGARLVVWPEGANLVLRDEEPALIAAAAESARRNGIELVVSYILPVTFEPLLYENRARWFAPDGTERLAYLKHHPVPGEPAVPGAAPAPTVDTAFGPATAAICYDYDFPSLARAHARSGAGLVAIPSSDWRGIDPIHTEMAAMRAIEGGFSIVRSTRFGLSGAIDAHGRLRGQQSTNETDEPYLLVPLPTTRIPTLYAALGNLVLLPLVAIVALAALVLAGVGLRRRARLGRDREGAALGGASRPEAPVT